ncbi:alpha/beta fold hydrolase [Nitratireductor soli]|uniref:alpha/beta fold hydrolase n=1 Tax=Nitratireductor soli TaxID=1670619 RepID=UPI00065E82EE|nr:alpha/beta hydrolase [Nitratireductor soli]
MAEGDFRDIFYSAQDGLTLHARHYGGDEARDGLPVICLPGLTRNARDFHELAMLLSQDQRRPRPVIAFDYRGRGLSDHDPDWKRYDVAVEAADIMAGLAVMGIEHGAFIGTSRGGLIIMVLAAMRPSLLKAVILNDIGPVVEGAGLAHIRAYLQRAPKPKTLAEAVEIQKAAHGADFSALDAADWQRFAAALYREKDGRLVADFDPGLLKPLRAIDLDQPLPTLWPQFDGLGAIPLMAIRGARSRLLSAQTLAEMAERHPAMEQITVDGQGHAPLLETGELPKRIAAFIARAER